LRLSCALQEERFAGNLLPERLQANGGFIVVETSYEPTSTFPELSHQFINFLTNARFILGLQRGLNVDRAPKGDMALLKLAERVNAVDTRLVELENVNAALDQVRKNRCDFPA
jgi:hypothetical protein